MISNSNSSPRNNIQYIPDPFAFKSYNIYFKVIIGNIFKTFIISVNVLEYLLLWQITSYFPDFSCKHENKTTESVLRTPEGTPVVKAHNRFKWQI